MNAVHPSEKQLFAACVVVSALTYLLLVVVTFGIGLVIGLMILGGAFLLLGWQLGQLRGNGVLVSEHQFPETHRVAREMAERMELAKPPAIYVVESGGALNAFATRFALRDYVVIYSDVLELAYEQGEQEVAFVIAHELAHLKRRHPTKFLLLVGARSVPGLFPAYSRACEHTCDRMAAQQAPTGAVSGLLVLAAGTELYRHIEAHAFARQTQEDQGFFVWLTEFFSSHPRLPRRVEALQLFVGQLGQLGQLRQGAGRVAMPAMAGETPAPRSVLESGGQPVSARAHESH